MKILRTIFSFTSIRTGILLFGALTLTFGSLSSVVFADPYSPPVGDDDAINAEDMRSINNYYAWSDPTTACAGVGDEGDSSSPMIVIDPGHSGEGKRVKDKETGLNDYDYPVKYESEEVMYVSLKVKEALKKAGYRVKLTKGDNLTTNVKDVHDEAVKQGANSMVTDDKNKGELRERANIANKANAALAVSVHTDHTQPWSFAEIYTQKVGLYRQVAGGGAKETFKNETVAEASQAAGKDFEGTRDKAEGRKPELTNANFAGRDLDQGNIPQVMLYANVPWVYNEAGGGSGYLSQERLDSYAKGIIEGVKKSQPIKKVVNSDSIKGTGDNPKDIFKYLTGKGLSGMHAAAVMGNLQQESGMNPNATNKSSGAYGIAQWLFGRKDNLLAFAAAEKKEKNDLGMQLDFLWKELNGPENASLKALKAANTIEKATEEFGVKFERASADEMNMPTRISNAKKYLEKYGDGAALADSDSGGAGENTCGGSSGNLISCDEGENANTGVRESVVCVAKHELEEWKSGAKKPGSGYQTYSQGRHENWCSDFASWVYLTAGHPITGSDKKWNLPGVIQVTQIAQDNRNGFKYHAAGGNYTPRPGDLALHSNDHINIVVAVNGKTITTIGGNEGGRGRGFEFSKVMESSVNSPGAASPPITGYASPD